MLELTVAQMSRVINYTPEWLSKPNPGHNIFAPAENQESSLSLVGKRNVKPGPRRNIARRGTEVFVAVGKEIRWADLVYLKDAWEHGQQKKNRRSFHGTSGDEDEEEDGEEQYDQDHAQGYRVGLVRAGLLQFTDLVQTLKTPVADEIKQLIISPSEKHLAILTTHTVHIVVLPDSSHLTAQDTSPFRPRITTLGPTTHVTSRAPISTALWHPLGVNGSCLVTITEDAVVRVWELQIKHRWSYDRPTLTIDLKKLADGTSLDQDFGASVSTNRVFTPDSFEMEVASACFGARGTGGWSSMTLWVAMREGDVYALCPLLPEKWSPPSELIPSLSISIVSKAAAMEDDSQQSESSKRLAQQQLAWMAELDSQEPVIMEAMLTDPRAEVYIRPSKPARVPKLQGPFTLDFSPENNEEELDNLLSDIYVIGSKMDADDLMFGEEDDLDLDDGVEQGLSMSVICLLTSSGRLSICLDIDGVEAQWLPKLKERPLTPPNQSTFPTLLTFDVLDTSRKNERWQGSWPMFSPDVDSRYACWITDTSSVTFISLSDWIFGLDSELFGSQGGDLRLGNIVKNQSKTIRDRVYTRIPFDKQCPLSASISIRDVDLGYFLLTTTPYAPLSITFEAPNLDITARSPLRRSSSRSPTYDSSPIDRPLIYYEPRDVFHPSHAFQESSALPAFLRNLSHSKYKRLLNEQIRLSPATLTILTDAHRLLSEETHRLGGAAAEVFRRCEFLQIELKEQIRKARDVAEQVRKAIGEDADDEDENENGVVSANEVLVGRIREARERQRDLVERLEKVRKRVQSVRCRPISERENGWFEEVKVMEEKVLGAQHHQQEEDGEQKDNEKTEARSLRSRYDELRDLAEDLLQQVDEAGVGSKKDGDAEGEEQREYKGNQGVKVTNGVRNMKVQKVMRLLERETALVEGARMRLEGLGLG